MKQNNGLSDIEQGTTCEGHFKKWKPPPLRIINRIIVCHFAPKIGRLHVSCLFPVISYLFLPPNRIHQNGNTMGPQMANLWVTYLHQEVSSKCHISFSSYRYILSCIRGMSLLILFQKYETRLFKNSAMSALIQTDFSYCVCGIQRRCPYPLCFGIIWHGTDFFFL